MHMYYILQWVNRTFSQSTDGYCEKGNPCPLNELCTIIDRYIELRPESISEISDRLLVPMRGPLEEPHNSGDTC